MRHDIIPCLRYADAPAAIEFLCQAFGFERQAIYADPHDPHIVMHAQLVWHDRMIMLGSERETEHTRAAGTKSVEAAGGVTSGLYLTVEDVDTHAARARAAGAAIGEAPRDQDYGGRGYTARDPGGYLWSFGSYDPWAT